MSHHSPRTIVLLLSVLLAFLALPAGAAQIDTLKVKGIDVVWKQPSPEYINIKVQVSNDGGHDALEYFDVRLLVRGNSSETWRRVKTWRKEELKAHSAITCNYQPTAIMDPVLYLGRFELKAEILDSNKQVLSDFARVFP